MSSHSSSALQQRMLSEQAQAFWVQWVENAFSDLDSCAYFLPPVYVNRVPMTKQSFAGQDVLVLQSAPSQSGNLTGIEDKLETLLKQKVSYQDDSNSNQLVTVPSVAAAQAYNSGSATIQESDIRDDAAMQHVFCNLQKFFKETRENLVGISQLQFGQYLGEPCYAAAAAQLPLPASLSPTFPRNWKHGDFDILLIHRHYGLVICEVKAIGDNFKELELQQQDAVSGIRKRLKQALSQLNKAEAMLSHLVSDIAPGLRITKTIAFPNLTAHQVQQAISSDLIKDLNKCLGTANPASITGLCLCSDQLSDPKISSEVSSDTLVKLKNWWQRCVAGSGTDSHMTYDVYKKLIARFCGPATTVTVPCIFPPLLCVKTLNQAVSMTGEFYTSLITLFPEQVDLLNMAHPRLFVAGPPGTGKTLMLLLMGTEWLRRGNSVHIVSTWLGSHAVCVMLYHLLLQTLNMLNTQLTSETTPGEVHLLKFDLTRGEDIQKAVDDLSQAARKGSLYVIADEVSKGGYFKTFCDMLLTRVPHLHLWAASFFHDDAPTNWQSEYLTRPLRSPPAVLREFQEDRNITNRRVQPYSQRGVPDHTQGLPVKRLYHRGEGHSGIWPVDCPECCSAVVSILQSLRVADPENVTSMSTTVVSTKGSTVPPSLQWRDLLVLNWGDINDSSGVVRALRVAGIPVRVMKDDYIEDVATARSDVVWVADGRLVYGLERKVVVCLESGVLFSSRLHLASRCTSQLVIVSC